MITINDICDIEIDGVDSKDYPDFCDAYFSSAYNLAEKRECTEKELDYLSDNYGEVLNQMAFKSLI